MYSEYLTKNANIELMKALGNYKEIRVHCRIFEKILKKIRIFS